VNDLMKIKNDAIEEAVKEATIPLIAGNEINKIEIENLKENIKAQESKTLWSSIIVGVTSLAVGTIIGFLIGIFR